MIGRQQYSGRSERGSVLVLVTLFIFVLFGFTALSIDVANVYREKHKAHDATDAAALAGVAKLGDSALPPGTQASDAINEAEVIAITNSVKHAEITASNTGTIEVGLWDGTSFTAGTTPYNAVRVPAQRTVTNNFGRVVGFPVMTPVVDSIATIGAQAMQYGVTKEAVDGVAINGTVTLPKMAECQRRRRRQLGSHRTVQRIQREGCHHNRSHGRRLFCHRRSAGQHISRERWSRPRRFNSYAPKARLS